MCCIRCVSVAYSLYLILARALNFLSYALQHSDDRLTILHVLFSFQHFGWEYKHHLECISTKICCCVMRFDGDERQLGIVRFMWKVFFSVVHSSLLLLLQLLLQLLLSNGQWYQFGLCLTATFMAWHKTDIQFLPVIELFVM